MRGSFACAWPPAVDASFPVPDCAQRVGGGGALCTSRWLGDMIKPSTLLGDGPALLPRLFPLQAGVGPDFRFAREMAMDQLPLPSITPFTLHSSPVGTPLQADVGPGFLFAREMAMDQLLLRSVNLTCAPSPPVGADSLQLPGGGNSSVSSPPPCAMTEVVDLLGLVDALVQLQSQALTVIIQV